MTSEQIAHFEDQGFLLYEGAFQAEAIERALQEIEPHKQKFEEFLRTQKDGKLFIAKADALTCWVALTDTDDRNGCPWVLPGRHHRGTLRHDMTEFGWECAVDRSGTVPVSAKAGDIVVFSSLTPHRTGPNTTNHVRKSYILRGGEPVPVP